MLKSSRTPSHLLLCMATVLPASGCRNQSFTGSTGQRTGAQQPPETNDSLTAGNEDEPTPSPSTTASGGKKTVPKTGAGVDGAAAAATQSKPNAGNLLNAIGGLISGIKRTLPNATLPQTGPNVVNFGGDKLFHIGDGYLDGSSCMAGVSTYELVGTKYFFSFEVKEAGTDVDITLDKICGVDFPDTNVVSLVQDAANTAVNQKLLSTGARRVSISGRGLAPGKYHVLVEAKTGSRSAPAEKPDDADDFLLGTVSIQGNKPIVPGAVGTN